METKSLNEDLNVRLNLEYAVCNDICVIDTVILNLLLPAGEGKATSHSLRLEQALASATAEIQPAGN